MLKHRTFTEVVQQLQQHQQWKGSLDMLPAGFTVGCLHVETQKLKAKLLPASQQAIDQLKGRLLLLAREACVRCLAGLQARIGALQQRPEALSEFVAFQVKTSA